MNEARVNIVLSGSVLVDPERIDQLKKESPMHLVNMLLSLSSNIKAEVTETEAETKPIKKIKGGK